MNNSNIDSPESIIESLFNDSYVADPDLAVVLYLVLKLNKPLLVEGPPGVGKTEIGLALSRLLNAPLIRLQCYEGLDINNAVYEWNYQKQLLSIKLLEQSGSSLREKENIIFSDDYILKRPLLQAITESTQAPVLLIDEIDRADEEFEAYLLELLSAYQISIPELGTIKATHKPIVILTSNRTRELSDALKRRCLYHWIDFPSKEKEMKIIEKRLPGIENELLQQVVNCVQILRTKQLAKQPGISETLDWAESLVALGYRNLNTKAFEETLGVLLKSKEDIKLVSEAGVESFVQ
ncbi:MAG: MoxR family ATPase [Saprospiraceae bacterium]|nr:MoxR family ATPase [Saprospiraceae bacterium]